MAQGRVALVLKGVQKFKKKQFVVRSVDFVNF